MAIRTMFRASVALTAGAILLDAPVAALSRRACVPRDPFKVLDPQNWVNPDDMTWGDYKAPPGTDWSNPARKGSIQNFNIALVTVDYPDMPFVITQPAHSHIFDNPQLIAQTLTRGDVPKFYRDLLNTPNDLNKGHTLHEYWMGDSFGRYGVDLTAFGPYRLSGKSYQYGIDTEDFNPGGCPDGEVCGLELRDAALPAWQADVGNETASAFSLVFILSAGHDESSTWQEKGEMLFTKDTVPDSFGPPGNGSNWAHTRYVDWTSWASAACIWPNAGGGSSTQAESSGMGTYAHELSHLLSIGDNYNNPYGVPMSRDYMGPFSMMSRGSFNGPGGPHTRWKIPSLEGGSLGSLHTVRDKSKIGLIDGKNVFNVTRNALATQAVVVQTITARSVDPGSGFIGVFVNLDRDLEPACSVNTNPYCDRGGYNFYSLEVVDRMGADSFQPDHGVLITKCRTRDTQPFQWAIDANPQDLNLTDFTFPNGTISKITIGDYRQLLDSLFHAGTRSGSQYEYVDTPNRLHFYILSMQRSSTGVLSYTVGVRNLDSIGGGATLGASLASGEVSGGSPTGKGVYCSFTLKNTGTGQGSDVFRLKANVSGAGWKVALPTEIVAVGFGNSTTVRVAVGATGDAADTGTVELVASSELSSSVTATGQCSVKKVAS